MGKTIKCAFCAGLPGHDPIFLMNQCRVCHGDGEKEISETAILKKCLLCQGLPGFHSNLREPCPKCGGWGYRIYEQKPIELVYVTGKKRYTDRKNLEELLKGLSGKIEIIETYFDEPTLDILHAISNKNTIRVLIGKPSEKYLSDKLLRRINDFKHEFPNFSFKIMNEDILHDRFIVDENGILIINHGLKDFAKNKESTIHYLQRDTNIDTYNTILQAFENNWKNAKNI